ncbi:phosphinothricin acetyltransferase [Tindallia magadiensis]|uniref:Phosphinothricin acetyltransferase n=1 Tax=Tindallia magadiensis TaxID=69895 RepID=A0A1I3AQ90_9FIRM|nr:arsinothricin resistance N-acetyltransferase ArsN1 family A [Tindallia magadiensis]SFH52152.1 phosphinothricin acetyltransferase [Tindallia magadiensis]
MSNEKSDYIIRLAQKKDLPAITFIYNQGISTRYATLESEYKNLDEMKEWFMTRKPRYCVIILEYDGEILGWASLNPFHYRTAYDGVADFSIYISENHRGKGLGKILMKHLENLARENNFYKLVLFTPNHNESAKKLYINRGFRVVGIYYHQGKIDDKWIDIAIMEKLLVNNPST